MNRSQSPCHRCHRADTCGDDLDDVCGKYRKWLAPTWPKLTHRAAIGTAALHLYRAGKNDYQIAAEVGVTPSAICQWRKRKGLPSVGKRGPKPRKGTCAERGRWEGMR